MDKNPMAIVFVIIMIIIIIAVDILLFRHYFWARLASNVGIILIFLALYLRFIR